MEINNIPAAAVLTEKATSNSKLPTTTQHADLLLSNVTLFDGSGLPATLQDVAICGDLICAVGQLQNWSAERHVDVKGLALAPGFIDVHTHDDLEVLRNPSMLYKLSQGVCTVIVGNCGISASPLTFPEFMQHEIPDPINLLGKKSEFVYRQFSDYVKAVEKAKPAVNVLALVGHTALRTQVMHELHQTATDEQIAAMQALLLSAMQQGAVGMSTGLAYHNANSASLHEIEQLAGVLSPFGGKYTTHLRTEFDGILTALDEAFTVGRHAKVDVIISHLKCAGKANWGRSAQVLEHITQAQQHQHIGCDCYPYNASSSTLDLAQVTDDFAIFITWSDSHPEMAGNSLQDIAKQWDLGLLAAAEKLQPAGAVYHGMDENDVQAIIQFPHSMIGSDGLPCDPHPHPRLWGSFPRVLGHYAREQKLLPLAQAIHKMTGLSAKEFAIERRGLIKPGYFADLVLFDPYTIKDNATFADPKQAASGVLQVWVNGKLSYQHQDITQYANLMPVLEISDENVQVALNHAGRFLKHQYSSSNN
ncbi:D-aminoacylase [Paraglaciecola sp.]|uniref:N-acyl-D-amino-acid deacylase family protein n=1 Tax=Paraglaciecola sp. TaxID=1920173 RepID=UPI0030F44B7B